MLIVLLGLAATCTAQNQTSTRFLGGALNALGQAANSVLGGRPVGFGNLGGRPVGIGGLGGFGGVQGGFGGFPIQQGGFVRPPIQQGFPGGFPGSFPTQAPSSGCRYWCRTPQGQAYCCEGTNQSQSFVGVKPGNCPPVRPVCPPTRNFGPPSPCSNDGSCSGVDKCCFDTCLQQHTCKAPLGFGR